jgi:hypothetical protein
LAGAPSKSEFLTDIERLEWVELPGIVPLQILSTFSSLLYGFGGGTEHPFDDRELDPA